MLRTYLGSDKYQFYKSSVLPSHGSNPRSPARETRALLTRSPRRVSCIRCGLALAAPTIPLPVGLRVLELYRRFIALVQRRTRKIKGFFRTLRPCLSVFFTGNVHILIYIRSLYIFTVNGFFRYNMGMRGNPHTFKPYRDMWAWGTPTMTNKKEENTWFRSDLCSSNSLH